MHKLRSSDIDPEVRQLVRTLQDSAAFIKLSHGSWMDYAKNEEDDDIRRSLMKACRSVDFMYGKTPQRRASKSDQAIREAKLVETTKTIETWLRESSPKV
jgi:hypothetical protein